jgi:hypothetical protein
LRAETTRHSHAAQANGQFNAWAEIARAVPIEREIDRRGIKLKRQGVAEFVGPCPKCGGDDRFAINTKKQVFNCRGCDVGGDIIKLVEHLDGVDFFTACGTLAKQPPPKAKDNNHAREPKKIVAAEYLYHDEGGNVLFAVERIEFQNPDGSYVLKDGGKRRKTFRQKRPDPDRPGKWIWNIEGVPVVPYRLSELIEAIANQRNILIVEGEAKVDLLRSWNAPATCCAGGAEKWRREHAEFLRGADVVIVPDNDDHGDAHVGVVARSLQDIAASIRVLNLPGLPVKGDIIDWRDQGGTIEQLHDLIAREAKPWVRVACAYETNSNSGVRLRDFFAYMPQHSYIFAPSRELWPASSVNARLLPLIGPDGKPIRAATWLDRNAPVEQMTWAPGRPMLVRDRLISDGGWIERNGVTCFNLYRPPIIKLGDPKEADPWLSHVHKVYPDDAPHIIKWLAHRVQRPAEKVNHALVLGGKQGIGKDTLLEPVKQAIGPWNFSEVSPQQVLGRFNGFLKCVILRVSEARDLGDIDRFQFYNHMKAYTAAPPDVLRVDEKNLREYSVLNCMGMVITSNHKADGIYLPADDRRHFVAWSDLSKEDFNDGYWNNLWGFYASGGDGHVAAYLDQLNISTFDAKAPPPKTQAFWEIVDASRAPEDAELADAIDAAGSPDTVTLEQLANHAPPGFSEWLRDRKNARRIPHRLDACGYVAVRNDAAKDGLWKLNGRRQAIYAKADLSPRDRIAAATDLTR